MSLCLYLRKFKSLYVNSRGLYLCYFLDFFWHLASLSTNEKRLIFTFFHSIEIIFLGIPSLLFALEEFSPSDSPSCVEHPGCTAHTSSLTVSHRT